MPKINKEGKEVLTYKEQLFVKEMIKTKGNRTESASRVYNHKSRKNAKQYGRIVANRPAVKRAIHEAMESQGITVDWLLEKEKKIINEGLEHGKPTMSDARLSIQNLHKLLNTYPAKTNKNLNLNVNRNLSEENTNEITQSLKKLTELTQKLLEDVNS